MRVHYKTVSVDYVKDLSFQTMGLQSVRALIIFGILYLNSKLFQNLYNVYTVMTSDFNTYMQVISGKYKRRKLVFTKNTEVRPTKQIVKESVFNIIQGRVEGARFLDLCAGSGSMGIEALSRGASYACFVDIDIKYIQRNLEFVEEAYDVKRGRAESYLKYCKESFDIIFLIPRMIV